MRTEAEGHFDTKRTKPTKLGVGVSLGVLGAPGGLIFACAATAQPGPQLINRLSDEPEKRFETGQAWSEIPNQPHYIVNASRTGPAQLVVAQIVKAGTKVLTEPMPVAAGSAK